MNQREVWETIANSWARLRTKPEEEVVGFAEKISGRVLDAGCGNCRNLLPFLEKGLECFGLDFSRNMIKEAKKFLRRRNLKAYFIVGDITKLPFKPKAFSTVLLIRSLPHLDSAKKRLECLKEVKRVGSKVLMSCWYKWNRKLLWTLVKHFFSSDVYVEWNYYGRKYKRFYHLYTKRELEDDLKKVEIEVKKIWFDGKGNIWVLA